MKRINCLPSWFSDAFLYMDMHLLTSPLLHYTCMAEMQQWCALICCTNGFLDIDAPTNLMTREVTEDSALVTWDKVQADVDGYMLSYSSIDGSSQEVRVGADSASYRFTALKPGVLYTVYVWAIKGPRSSKKSSTEAETGFWIVFPVGSCKLTQSSLFWTVYLFTEIRLYGMKP